MGVAKEFKTHRRKIIGLTYRNGDTYMKKKWIEQTTLLISILKWTLYSSVIGVIVGTSTTLFLRLLDLAISVIQSLPEPLLFTPLFLILSKLLVDKIAPDAAGYGTDRLIEAVHNKKGKIRFIVVPVKLIASVLTIASGGSAGKIGPCGQIGAGLASAIANLLRIDDTDRRKLVVCGISAGFAAVFGTPIGGALFGVEVLFLGRLLYEILFPAFVAGLTAYHIANSFGITYFHRTIELIPYYSEWTLLKCVLLGVLSGLVALLFIESLEIGKHRSSVIKKSLLPPLVGGLLLIIFGMFVSPAYLGLGLDTIQMSLQGCALVPYAFLAKIFTTAITFFAGGSGGIILPTVFIGTSVGNLFAQLTGGSYLAVFSAVGMVSVLAAATNTPIASTVIAIELFGPEIAPFAAVSCAVSYLAVGHNSIFPTQVLVTKKSASLVVDTGIPIQNVDDIEVKPHGNIWRILFKWLHIRNDPDHKN